MKLFGFVSGRDVDKFARFNKYELSSNGAPLLLDAKAFYEIQVLKDLIVDVGTHNLRQHLGLQASKMMRQRGL